jgi:hypothetical protein
MELPYMIFEEAKRLETKDQSESCITFTLNSHFCDLHDYQITIVPIKNNIQIIKYKTAKFYCDNNITYDKISDYLVSQIEREIYSTVTYYQEWNDYDPTYDDEFENFSIIISANKTELFRQNFINDNKGAVFEALKQHLKPYFHISHTRIHVN